MESNRSDNQQIAATLTEYLTMGQQTVSESKVPPDLSQLVMRVRWDAREPAVPLEVRISNARNEFGIAWVNELLRATCQQDMNILASLDLDSSWELVFALRLLKAGWRFARTTLLNLGCRWLVRDRDRDVYVGDVQRWILTRTVEDTQMALFPQVTIQAKFPYRLDFSGVVVRDKCRAEWRAEVDGPDHERRMQKDIEGTLIVNLPTIRIVRTMLMDTLLSDRLLAFARPLCKLRPPTRDSWR